MNWLQRKLYLVLLVLMFGVTATLFLTNSVQAQQETDPPTSVQITQEVMQRVDALASSMGMTAEQMWPYYVKQHTVEGTIHIVVWVLFFVCGTAFIITGLVLGRKRDDTWGYTLCGIIAVVTSVCLLSFVGLPKRLNPEYYAIQSVVKHVGTVVHGPVIGL